MMKCNKWGKGKTVCFKNSVYEETHGTFSGGMGTTVTGSNTFCLKLVSLMAKDSIKIDGTVNKEKGVLSDNFWQEAESASLYYSIARNISSCVSCPVPPHYWIHQNDPLFQNFPHANFGEKRMCSLRDFISLFDIQPEQLDKIGIEPKKYWLAPDKLVKNIRDKTLLASKAKNYLKEVPELHKKIFDDAVKCIFDDAVKCNMLLTYPLLKGEGKVEAKDFDDKAIQDIQQKVQDYTTKSKGRHISEDKKLEYERQAEICKRQAKDQEKAIRRLIYQILSAILDLYRNGLAHCDIKPENIMYSTYEYTDNDGLGYKRKKYFLTDIGVVQAGDKQNLYCTEIYFHEKVYKEWQNENAGSFIKDKTSPSSVKLSVKLSEEELKTLLIRTLMDGHALALTILDLSGMELLPWDRASIHEYPINTEFFDEKWPKQDIKRFFEILYDVKKLTIGKMQEIVVELAKDFAHEKKSIAIAALRTYGQESEFKFNSKYPVKAADNIDIEYGFLQEQLNLSGKCNPMMRVNISSKIRTEGLFLPPDIIMQPIIQSYTNGNNVFRHLYYAPDNMNASRVSDEKSWGKYSPYTLEKLKKNNKQQYFDLLDMGECIDGYIVRYFRKQENNDCLRVGKISLPYPQDIVMVDGTWMIQPFFIRDFTFVGKFSVKEYFKMLCGKENNLTKENWADLLVYDYGVGILFDLIPDTMAQEVAGLLKKSPKVPDKCNRTLWEKIQEIRRVLKEKLSETEKFKKYF